MTFFLRRKSRLALTLSAVLIVFLEFSAVLAQSALTLEQALQRFMDQSPAIQAGRARVEAAEGRLLQSSVRPNPTLNYSQEGYPFGEDRARYFDDQEFLIWASQKFELGDKRGHRTDEARFQLQRIQSEYEAFVNRSRAEIKELFAEAHYRQAQASLAEDLITRFQDLVEIHRQRLQAGDVSGVSQLKLEAEGIAYQARLGGIQTSLTEAWFRLASRIGWDEAALPELRLNELPDDAELDELGLEQMALESRADLAALERGLEESDARVRLERAQGVPDLMVGAGYKRDFGRHSYYLALQLPIPIFDRNRGAIDAASAEQRRQQSLVRLKQREVRREVGESLARYRQQRTIVARLDDTVNRVERVAEITRQSYLEGEASLLEVLDSLRVQRDAALDYYDLLLQLRRSWVLLETSVGREIP